MLIMWCSEAGTQSHALLLGMGEPETERVRDEDPGVVGSTVRSPNNRVAYRESHARSGRAVAY